MKPITPKEAETLLIMQEECGEVAQVISKAFRFGLDESWINKTNRQRLEQEIGDVLCMIDLLDEFKIIDHARVREARIAKRFKLEQWTTHLFNKEQS